MASFSGALAGGFTGAVATRFAVVAGGADCGGCGAAAGVFVDEFVDNELADNEFAEVEFVDGDFAGNDFAEGEFADNDFAGAGFPAASAGTAADCAVGRGFGDDELAWVRAPRECRAQRTIARTRITTVTATMLQGVPVLRSLRNSFFGGWTSSARGSCRSGSSSNSAAGWTLRAGLR